eukprot:CAMPEP_0177397120 /NCGR_PEP_ID=MMETSP0368-20130122/57138_1 /TAXON_ID=447022 ORGANISM="Scrippsiella hangoei-like, Strain SHHI-4" /NCGR_SAMPLE_ID=MMETSP0368 /ASSEMBLY_ACC=CAM_ASM_000363 /LENGTH=77 /DNA_ID=CAMNT_0018863995 /DNA_START=21 /DNA_END=251 /DNA_ORIENTATION=+
MTRREGHTRGRLSLARGSVRARKRKRAVLGGSATDVRRGRGRGARPDAAVLLALRASEGGHLVAAAPVLLELVHLGA